MSTNINKILILWTLCCFLGSGKAPTFDWEALPDPAPTASESVPTEPQIPSPSPARLEELHQLERTEMDPESYLKAFKQFLAALIYEDNQVQIELKLQTSPKRINDLLGWIIGHWYSQISMDAERLDILAIPPKLKSFKPELPLNTLVTYQLVETDLPAGVARLIVTKKEILQILYTDKQYVKYLKYTPSPELIQNLRIFWEEHLPHDRPSLGELSIGLVKSAWFIHFMLAYKNQLSPTLYQDGLVWPIGRRIGSESALVSLVLLIYPDRPINCLQIRSIKNQKSQYFYLYYGDSGRAVQSEADVPPSFGLGRSQWDSTFWTSIYGAAITQLVSKQPGVQRIDAPFENYNDSRPKDSATELKIIFQETL